MNKQKIGKQMLVMVILISSLSLFTLADSTFSSVTFTNPLNIGNSQTITANISSTGNLSSIIIEIINANHSMTLTNGQFEYSWTPNQGTTTFKIYALDTQNTTSLYQSSFLVKDLTSPLLTLISPTSTVTSETANLKILTDENSTCKYDTANKAYDLMSNFFQTTGALTHESVLTHLTTGIKEYYFSCKDTSSNFGNLSTTFNVNLGPTAQITLSKVSPLKADTYKISVLTSKQLSSTPSLQYKFDDEQKNYQVSLVGQDSDWSGYLVISSESKDRIGTFSFQGTDYDGLSGNKITDGALFIVDTTKPIAPISLSANINEDEIAISWFYEGEKTDKFNIYRSTVPGVEYVDYYDTDRITPYYDSGIENAKDYYYRVAAVDKAGNIGDLSSEVHILFNKNDVNEINSDNTPTNTAKLSATLEKRLNITYSNVKTLKFDVRYTLSQLEKQTDRFKTITINELNLIDTIKSEDSNIDSILSELDNLRVQDLSDKEFDDAIKNIQEKINKIKDETVSEITIIDSLEFTQSTSQSELTLAINELFLRKELDETTKLNYTKAAESLQDSSIIFETAIIIKTKSLSGKENYVTLITKEISTSQESFNTILLESIPKTYAESSKDIIFSQNPVILKDDPVVYWSYPKIDNVKFSYYINEKKQISDVKDAKTLILPDPSKFISKKGVYSPESQTQNKVIGNSIFESSSIKSFKDYIFLGIGIIIISALVVYYFFFINDSGIDTSDNDEYSSPKQGMTQVYKTIQPQFQQDSYTDYSDNKTDEKHMINLINHAEIHANNLNFEQAAKEYALIYSFFNSSTFNTDFKSKVAKKISSLHKNISVKKKIELANDTAIKGDLALLCKIVKELEATKDSFSKSEKHPLKDYVKEYYDYYSSILSNQNKKIR